MLADGKLADSKRVRIENELFQAEEALLALDTRERHALRERYEELITQLRAFHFDDPTKIPDVEECFSFDGDSFKKKLIEICMSHNEDADVLVERDREQFDRPRFPRDYPVGMAVADTHLAAAALRLADILDFDRERTPPTLFHYLVPSSLSHSVNISELEWGKHLSISNWEIEQSAVVFRGRCKNHIVHHAVVQFSKAIEEEIASTRATFAIGDGETWPFILPEIVKADIHEDSYHYVPYQFELDDSRVYELLMGRAIYGNPLVAVRELVQNAVDACTYRDALSRLAEPNTNPDTQNRITVRYEEPSGDKEYPTLRVIDTGTGMDAWLIERWFLKVGRSFYNSTEFARDRAQLRHSGIDFAPVSEFGIGFLACFLLADRVDVETAMWEPIRGDTRKRHLEIDGPTRLIRIREDANAGLQRLRGTRVSLTLVPVARGHRAMRLPRPRGRRSGSTSRAFVRSFRIGSISSTCERERPTRNV
jgi:molecular chaperone HtpG